MTAEAVTAEAVTKEQAMRAFEERWAVSALEGFAPPRESGFSPEEGQVDYSATFRCMLGGASPRARLALRVGVWMLALSPLWLGFGRRTLRSLPLLASPPLLSSLSLRQRSRIFGRLLRHRFYLVRELTLIFKVIASMAIFQVAELRARAGYERRPLAQEHTQPGNTEPRDRTSRPPRRLRVIATPSGEANVA